jgi:hypothetical protein
MNTETIAAVHPRYTETMGSIDKYKLNPNPNQNDKQKSQLNGFGGIALNILP